MQKQILRIVLYSWLWSKVLCLVCDDEISTIEQEVRNKKITSYKQGDYIIQSLQSITDGGTCDQVTISGLLRTYAVKFVIDTVNRNSSILPNVTLGWKINDACLSVPVTMARGIELSNSYRYSECTAESKNNCVSQLATKPAIAVIGAYFSFNSLPLATLLSLHDVPQISFGASSPLFNKKTLYPSFFRTIPSDASQVQTIIDILTHFNWTYVFAVGSNDNYGKLAIADLKSRVLSRGICITGDVYISFESSNAKSFAKEIALRIKKESRATVVVMFNYAVGMGEYILQEVDKLNLHRIWLTSEAWNPEVLSANIPSRQLESIITVSLMTGNPLPEFVQYLREVVDNGSACDVWLHEFVKTTFQCDIKQNRGNQLIGKTCNGTNCSSCVVSKETIIETLLNHEPCQINSLVDAVDAIVHALDSLVTTQCSNSTHCPRPILPRQLKESIKNVDFVTRQNHEFQFDEFGNPAYFAYSIEQVVYNKSLQGYQYTAIAHWDKQHSFQDLSSSISWPSWSDKKLPRSSCSIDCQPGEYVIGKRECCWECQPCQENMISEQINSQSCKQCPVGHHTLDNRYCIKTPIRYLSFLGASGLIMSVLNIIGAIVTVVAFFFFIYFQFLSHQANTSREFIYLSTVLLLLTFFYPVIQLVEPTHASCIAQPVYFHMLLSFYGTALLKKNYSFSRFLTKFSSNKEKSHFINVFIFLTIQFVEVVLLVTWMLVGDVPVTSIFNETSIFKQCEITFTPMRIAVLSWPCLILLIATIQSSSDRINFVSEEEKYVYFTTCTLCIVTVSYVVTVNYVVGEYQALVALITISVFGFAYLVCMVLTSLFKIWKSPIEKEVDGVLNICFQAPTLDNIHNISNVDEIHEKKT